VVSGEEKIVGVLTFEMLKELLVDRDTWQWLVVGDVMQPVREHLLADTNLGEAMLDMQNMQVEALPVLESADSGKLLGVMDLRESRRLLGNELVRRQTIVT
jgi:CBS domain-containing protein